MASAAMPAAGSSASALPCAASITNLRRRHTVRKLLLPTLAALVISAILVVLVIQTTRRASIAVADLASLTTQVNGAQDIRKEMLVMGDAMRGFLLDPTQKTEWDAKMAADERLVKAVD